MFQAISDTCIMQGFNVSPEKVICDFEKAAMNAVKNILGDDIITHGCFYHLTQATWRKIQNLGLTALYKESEDIRMFCGMMDGLGFLPIDSINAGMNYLRKIVPNELTELLDYFNETYVSGLSKIIPKAEILQKC